MTRPTACAELLASRDPPSQRKDLERDLSEYRTPGDRAELAAIFARRDQPVPDFHRDSA